MYSKNDFKNAIAEAITQYPSLGLLYQASDPRILQHLEAIATMFAMLSAQIETAMSEPFEKVRDSTVLADSAMRGIFRKATPATVQLRATNQNDIPVTIDAGRNLLDASGYPYMVSKTVTIPAGETGFLYAIQERPQSISHTVQASEPFYAILLPKSDDGSALCEVSVRDASGDFVHRDSYINTFPHERVFHLEADDLQQLYVRFGWYDVVGTQPNTGDVIQIDLKWSFGDVKPDYDSSFALEYINNPAEARVDLKLESIVQTGINPISMTVLRDLARYPSVYNRNAVFLGEFDFLIRYHFPTLKFLSVWNEATEEAIRGPSLDNINTLFVACLSEDESETCLTDGKNQQAVIIQKAQWTATQKAICNKILEADDSYKVTFYAAVRSPITMRIIAYISTAYSAADVKAAITTEVLKEFGESATAARHGMHRPLYQRVYALLKSKIPALSGNGADLQVEIDLPPSLSTRPELFRYVAENTLAVTVETAAIDTPSWSA